MHNPEHGLVSRPHDALPGETTPRRDRAATLGSIVVLSITLGFGLTLSALLWAKWRNFDPYMHDFAEAARIYEKLLRGVPYAHRMHYYLFFYMGICPAFLPFYAAIRNIAVIFSVHILSFTLTIPLLYLIARQMLPGVLLPLALVTCYVLNPTVDLTAIGFLRLEACWMPLFLLALYLVNKGSYRAAVWSATAASFVRLDAAPAILLLGIFLALQKKRVVGISVIKGSLVAIATMAMGAALFRLASGIPLDFEQLHIDKAMIPERGLSLTTLLSGAARTLLEPASYIHFRIILQFLLLPLLAPLYLVPALFSAFYIIFSTKSFLSNPIVLSLLAPHSFLVPFLHTHDSYLVPILFVAMIAAMRKICSWTRSLFVLSEHQYGFFKAAFATILMAYSGFVHWTSTPPALGPVPLTPAFNLAYYRSTPHARLAWETLASLPQNRPGLLQGSFADRAYKLVHIQKLYKPIPFPHEAEYALFDLFAFSAEMPKPDLLAMIEDFLRRGDVCVERFEDGILLLRRGTPLPENQRVVKYISDNREWLSRNRASPYQYGHIGRQEALARTFSATLLPPEELR